MRRACPFGALVGLGESLDSSSDPKMPQRSLPLSLRRTQLPPSRLKKGFSPSSNVPESRRLRQPFFTSGLFTGTRNTIGPRGRLKSYVRNHLFRIKISTSTGCACLPREGNLFCLQHGTMAIPFPLPLRTRVIKPERLLFRPRGKGAGG